MATYGRASYFTPYNPDTDTMYAVPQANGYFEPPQPVEAPSFFSREPTAREYGQLALNVGSRVVPPLALLNTAIGTGQGGYNGYMRGVYGVNAPEEEKPPTVAGKQFLGNLFFGNSGVGKTVGEGLGWLIGKGATLFGAGSVSGQPVFDGPPTPDWWEQPGLVPPKVGGPPTPDWWRPPGATPSVSFQEEGVNGWQPSYQAEPQDLGSDWLDNYLNQSVAPRLENSRTLQPNFTAPDMSAAMRSLQQAYENPSYYDTAGGGWKSGTGEGVGTAQLGYKGGLFSSVDSSPSQSESWSPWYAGQPDPFSLTGNMLDAPWAGDFGGGRFAYGDGLASSIGATNYGPGLDPSQLGWGPMARFDSDPFGTN